MIFEGREYTEHKARFIALDNAKARKVEYRPIDAHYDTVLKAPCIVTIDGERVIVAQPAPTGAETVRVAVARIKRWEGKGKNDGRALGLKSINRTFGYRPRLAIRHDFCSRAIIAREHPEVESVLFDWSRICSERLAFWMPNVYAEQKAWAEHNILPEWRISDSVYTSGIINQTSALGYHRDQGNHEGSWSSMLVFQRDTEGGLLVMPELRLAFDFDEPTLIQFDGMRVLHGVTKIRTKTPHAYRYSIVWYLREQLKAGLPFAKEMARYQKIKTEREVARSKLTRDELIDRLGGDTRKWLEEHGKA